MTILETLLEEFYARLPGFARINPRETELPKLKDKIKAVIGMRRTGKTYFLYQQIDSLLKSGLDKQRILYINFEDDRISPMGKREFAQLLDNFYSLYPENHQQLCYLFLDEIQNVDEWAQVVRRFFDSKPVEIILSGSSAKLLSKEIATSLRGRSYTTEIWPYSFYEYLKLQQLLPKKDQPIGKITLDKLLSQLTVYLKNGGFPEVLTANEEERFHTLQDYVEIVTYRDIIERHKITNIRLVKHMIKHLTQNTASNFSVNKFYNDLKSQGFKVSRGTIYDYLSYIEDAYLNFSVTLYGGSLRKSQVNPRKIYVSVRLTPYFPIP